MNSPIAGWIFMALWLPLFFYVMFNSDKLVSRPGNDRRDGRKRIGLD